MCVDLCVILFNLGGNLRVLILFRLRCSENVGNLELMPLRTFKRLWEEFCTKNTFINYLIKIEGRRVLKCKK